MNLQKRCGMRKLKDRYGSECINRGKSIQEWRKKQCQVSYSTEEDLVKVGRWTFGLRVGVEDPSVRSNQFGRE